MEKDRAMKETKELLNLLVVIFAIVLLCFCSVTTACPLCPPCYAGNQETGCVWMCSSGESCCGTSCYNTSTTQCCDQETGKTCPKPEEDWECCDDHCCATYDCESCDNGTCEYCNNDPCQGCCDGTCYDIETKDCCENLTIYNKATKKCCNDGLGNICPKDDTCCDGECYDPTTEKCCDPPGDNNGKICTLDQCCVDGECVDDGDACGTNQTCCDGSCCALPKCCIDGDCETPSWLPNGSVSVSADPTIVNKVNAALSTIPGVNVSLTGLAVSVSCNLKKCCEPPGTLGNKTCAAGTVTISTTIGKTTVWGSPPIAVRLGTDDWEVSFTAFAGVWIEGELSASGTAGKFTNDCGQGCLYGSASIGATGSVSAGGTACCCVTIFGEPHCGEAEVSGSASISFTGTVQTKNECDHCEPGVTGSIELGDIVFTGKAKMGGLEAILGPYTIYPLP